MSLPGALDGYRTHLQMAGGCDWFVCETIDHAIPEQGWKLHISATIHNCGNVLAIALKILVRARATFKIVATVRDLTHINTGKGGLSQIGKFITVYPVDDQVARTLSLELDQALATFAGPSVPSDQPVRPGSVVHYRYGSFDTRWLRNAQGLMTPAIRDSAGVMREEIRATNYTIPDGQTPLFSNGEATERTLIADRYLVVSEMARTHKAAVLIALDVRTGDPVAIKHAFAHCYPYGDSTTATELLQRENDIMQDLQGVGHTPRARAFWQDISGAYLVHELFSGLSLPDIVASRRSQIGRTLTEEEALDIFTALASHVAALHTRRVVHRDLKPGNVIVDPNDLTCVWLVDLETACPVGTATASAATRGYKSVHARNGAAATMADDHYALGALLVYLLSGFDFSYMPNEDVDPLLFLEVLVPSATPMVVRLAQRYFAAAEVNGVETETASLVAFARRTRAALHKRSVRVPSSAQRSRVRRFRPALDRLPDALQKTLCRLAVLDSDGLTLVWKSAQPYAFDRVYPHINIGSAGVLLYLSLRFAANRDTTLLDVLRRGCGGLLKWCELDASHNEHGFMMGGHGVCFAIAAVGVVLDDEILRAAAAQHWVRFDTYECVGVDLFNGMAGIALASLMLTHELGVPAKSESLARLLADAERDLESFTTDRLGGLLGFAHGLAGVGYVFAVAARLTADERCQRAAERIGDYLLEKGRPLDTDSTCWVWPPSLTGAEGISHGWCHGTVGFGQFFLELATLTASKRYMDAACSSGFTVCAQSGALDSTLCHGLSGAIDFLLELSDVTGEPMWRAAADQLARALVLRSTILDDALVWISESPEIITPDLLVGMAGVGAVLERLTRPSTPRLLSAAGARFLASKVQLK